MKIAIYNWALAHGDSKEGGGVALYVRNIAAELARMGHDVYVLSGGFVYDVLSRRVYLRKANKGRQAGIKYIDIVNSRVLAPSFMMFDYSERALECAETSAAVEEFLEKFGPFDVFHIQNIEGIPFGALELKSKFPRTKFILSNHNYHAICSQVNLWVQDRARCVDYQSGAACYSCNIFRVDKSRVLASRVAEALLPSIKAARFRRLLLGISYGLVRLRRGWRKDFGVLQDDRYYLDPPHETPLAPPADRFRRRRAEAVRLINQYCDRVISVSKAVENILLGHGIDRARSRVNYIGTRHFTGEIKGKIWSPARSDGILRLAFLGYTRPDKGFQFLVDAIEQMPAKLWGRVALVFAGQITDLAAMQRLKSAQGRLAGLEIYQGYRQEQLGEILAPIDLGLVLPLWDDALPQVAIEFVCHGVPILVSDRGGQGELAADPKFIFSAGNIRQFWDRISEIYENPDLFEKFWRAERPLRSVSTHVGELLEIYGD